MKRSKKREWQKGIHTIRSVTNLSIQVGWGASTFVVQTSYFNPVYNLNNEYKRQLLQ
jgi:hypothetical protein